MQVVYVNFEHFGQNNFLDGMSARADIHKNAFYEYGSTVPAKTLGPSKVSVGR